MVIYRKYRPQTFAELIGQKDNIKIIENEIKRDKIAHAYLFTGPRGLGKTTTARLIAKAVNCLKRKPGQSEPCNQCQNCQELMQGRFLDLIELDAASQTGVDNVRENIIAYSRIPPTIGKYKIFVLDEVHMLSISAFNALLKTLEEPPPYVIFILATTEIHKLPETIISRCQRFEFTKVNPDEIVARLKRIVKQEKVKVDEQVLKNIAYRSEGCVRDAESLLNQILAIDDKEITLEQANLVIPPAKTNLIIKFIKLVFKHEGAQSVKMINQLIEEGTDLDQFVTDLIEFLRKLMLVKLEVVDNSFYWQQDEVLFKTMKEMAKEFTMEELINITEAFITTKTQFSYSEIAQFPLELAVLKLCSSNS